MSKRWTEIAKRADFKQIGRHFGIDQVTARVLVNRGLGTESEIREFLSGKVEDLPDPRCMKDGEKAAEILEQKIREKAHIRIIGDYDIDGVMSTYILKKALSRLGACVTSKIPHRVEDGYGLNRSLIEKAKEDGVDTLLTCDNGIAALEEIRLAKQYGMTAIVTDHHAIPYELSRDGERRYLRSPADAIVNPHQEDCPYPFKEICGAVVAWNVIRILYPRMGIPVREADEFLENAAFATVGDIMPLRGENRIIVKEGLKAIRHSSNPGMRALIESCGLEADSITAYHFGFILGPCINAGGRLDTAEKALELLFEEDPEKAKSRAQELTDLNERRKKLTEDGVSAAVAQCEEKGYEKDPVLVLYLPEIHESIAGIVAGRIREKYYKPTFILTDSQDFVKGSGRSTEEYSMYEEMSKCKELFLKYGGHPAAAGLSLARENVSIFRERINQLCPESCRGLTEKIRFDARMPVGYITFDLIRQLEKLEPFGKDNPRPLFAEKDLRIIQMRRIGREGSVMKLLLHSDSGAEITAVCFRRAEEMERYLIDRFGEAEVKRAQEGKPCEVYLSVLYRPAINEYRGNTQLQIMIEDYR